MNIVLVIKRQTKIIFGLISTLLLLYACGGGSGGGGGSEGGVTTSPTPVLPPVGVSSPKDPPAQNPKKSSASKNPIGQVPTTSSNPSPTTPSLSQQIYYAKKDFVLQGITTGETVTTVRRIHLPKSFLNINIRWKANGKTVKNNGLISPILKEESVYFEAIFDDGGTGSPKSFPFKTKLALNAPKVQKVRDLHARYPTLVKVQTLTPSHNHEGWQDLYNDLLSAMPIAGPNVRVAQLENGYVTQNTPKAGYDNQITFSDVYAADPHHTRHARDVQKVLFGCYFYPTRNKALTAEDCLRARRYSAAFVANDTRYITLDLTGTKDEISQHMLGFVTPHILNVSASALLNLIGSTKQLRFRLSDWFMKRLAILAFTAHPGYAERQNEDISGNIYNAVVVGVADLNHKNGTHTLVDNEQGQPRYKPDIVALGFNGNSTSSIATPVVANGAAAILGLAYDHPSGVEARHPETMKAIILAGARKKVQGFKFSYLEEKTNGSIPKFGVRYLKIRDHRWQNNLPHRPIDSVMGVGYYNFRNSAQIFFAGNQPAGQANLKDIGWDSDLINTTQTTKIYSFTTDGSKEDFSVVVSWFRDLYPVEHGYTPAGPWRGRFDAYLPDLKVVLKNSRGIALATSDALYNNLEHIYLPRLAAGQYTMQITLKNTPPQNMSQNIRYGIAWYSE